MEKGMIVDKQGLFFLLSCRGSRACPCLFEPQVREKPEKILTDLFREGRIENTGERFRVIGPLAEAVKQITEADRVACFCHGSRERELLYLYPGKTILAVQEMFRRRQSLRLTYLEKDDLRGFLEEQGLLGKDERWESRPCPEEELPPLPEEPEARGVLKKYPWIRLLVQVTDAGTGQADSQIGIVRRGLAEEILTENKRSGIIKREPYTADGFVERLWAEWKGE